MFPADARLVEIVPGNVALGGVLGGGGLDEAALGRVAALPGAAAAWPRMSLRVPVAALGPPRGLDYNWPKGMTLQIPVVGVAPEIVAADLGRGERFEDAGPGGAIPVVLSRRLLESLRQDARAGLGHPPAAGGPLGGGDRAAGEGRASRSSRRRPRIAWTTPASGWSGSPTACPST